MHYFKNIRTLLLFAVVIVIQSCGGKDEVIPEDKFARIISEMYLADQFVDQHPDLRAKTDTSALYDAVFKKHGYSRMDYQESIQYYLQKGGKFKEIHQEARKLLAGRENELRKIVELQSGIISGWWAADTVKIIPVEKLEQDAYLRAVKWILIKEVKTQWKLGDSAVLDIPQNIYWWENNNRLGVDSTLQKQGILVKDYLQKEDASKKENAPGDKLVPDTGPQQPPVSEQNLLREALPGKRLQDSLKRDPEISNPKKLHIR